jgi:hypothetical protein
LTVDALALLIILALIATIVSLVTGVVSMGRGGEFDQKHSNQLMWSRVGFQGIALILLVAALYFATA